jgi:PAS domain S-box-containing protein
VATIGSTVVDTLDDSAPDWRWNLLESIRDGLIVVDSQWRIVYVNRVAESLLRLRRDQAVGQILWGLLPRQNTELEATLLTCKHSGAEHYLREVHPNGRAFGGRIFDLWTYPMPQDGMAIRFEDVSERVQREAELARLAVEAQDANRAKSRFFAAVSHELRTPLNAIIGYAHLLRTEAYGSMTAGARRAADRTGVCAEHLARLVDDVLLMTAAEVDRLPVSPAPIRLEEYLPRAVEPLRMQAEAKGLRFGVRFADTMPPLETDPSRLRQLLNALVSNAVKFTAHGEVRIDVQRAADGADAVDIVVADTGSGIPAGERERIFAPFEQLGDPARTDSPARGTGLGLTIARQLAALLCAALTVEDTPTGVGVAFRLRIPLRCPLPQPFILETEGGAQ